MRLHALEMTAFGPYAARQRVDFDRLASSGLFLLEGPTGAGKSTVLDAVTYALYGGLAGDSAGDDRLRSHFAGPDAEPSVALEFSLRGSRYRITRVPGHVRPKRRGGGFTSQPSRVHLERLEAGGWCSLSASKAESGAMVTEAVGLNREQFTQVMLLPQGAFARFLHAGDDDRRQLLSRLFGTGLYDRITAELDRRRAEAAQARQEAERGVLAGVAAAAEAAGLPAGRRDELIALPRAERETGLKEAGEELARAVALTGGELAAAASAVTAARAADDAARRQAELMTRLTDALAALSAHELTRPAHQALSARLAAARRAEPVRPLLTALAGAEPVTAAARESLRQLAAGAVAGAERGGGPGEAVAAGEAAGLPDGRGGPQAAARAEAAEREALGLAHLAGQEARLPGLERGLAALEQAAADASERAARLAEARSGLPAQITRLAGELAQATAAAAGLAALRDRADELSHRRAAATEAAALQPQVEAARSALQAAVDRHQALVDFHQRLVETRLAGMAAELAAQIADGGPCPVCGSEDHPAPACAAAGAVSAADIGQAAARRDEAEAERDRLDARHAALAQAEAVCAAAAAGRAASDLAAEAGTLAGEIAAAQRAEADTDELATGLAAAQAELEASASDLVDAEKQASAASEQARAARDDLARLRAEVAAAAGGFGSVAARQAALRQAAGRDQALALALDRLAAAHADEMKARQRAEHESSAQGFASLGEAADAVLAPADQAAAAAEAGTWTATLAALTAAVAAGDLAKLDPGRASEAHSAAAAAADGLARAAGAEQAARGRHQAALAQAGRLASRMTEAEQADQAYDRLAGETEPVIRLAGLVKGTEGQRRVSLTTYVLRLWFGQVVAAANVRLSAMSAGRYQLKRTDEGGTRRERAGLTLAVIDRHTGAERSPASLSGGETFYTSLALALGLADVVRAEAGGVDLDTLFIDEGFGSLDPATLDQVMAVIDELRDRGRVVGIVSHLADLKDRVPERLEVRRLPDGSSAVTVVA